MILHEYQPYYDQLIDLSVSFIDKYCTLKSSVQKITNQELEYQCLNDYRFFAFTKGTKSLLAYRLLLENGHYEDALCLSRVIFESYISQRFFVENFDLQLQNDMIATPNQLIRGNLVFENGTVKQRDDRDQIVDYTQYNPDRMVMGKDKSYYHDLYSYLCTHSHCNASETMVYLDENCHFTLNDTKLLESSHLIGLFCFSKLFENVVLCEDITFETSHEEQDYINFLIDLTVFLYNELYRYSKTSMIEYPSEKTIHKLMNKMKNSYKEQLGRVDKSFVMDMEKQIKKNK